ncbi:STAS domain-containing protein [Saccharopolyspora erythraea]|uniref:STAS domain-containing protein n=1 Tax=Saccharopolyspora erythraea TaxID=1836 RepID=UPI001BADE687|nr:STAS domain-containing protein [Saccharopolyspora erythraea]QUH00660.1 STAS domain-containing protein [Saccharopolyspora erythraea]
MTVEPKAPHGASGPDLGEPAALPHALRVRISHPRPDAIVVTLVGEVDGATVERFEDALLPRLSAGVRLIVVDLVAVGFLGVAGLALLDYTCHRARAGEFAVRVVVRDREIKHALHKAWLDESIDCYPSVQAALEPNESPI